MNKLIAVCGLDCAVCPAYVASMKNDDELRKKTAAEWSKAFGFDFKSEMINCHGCLATDGVQVGHCAECEMRLCALGKDYKSCAVCADLSSCKPLGDFLKSCPEAKENLVGGK
jgi:hypothetical protein